jgi:DNA-binding NarL/FixJ family response regulator
VRVLILGDDQAASAEIAAVLQSRSGIEVLGPMSLADLEPGAAAHVGADVTLLLASDDHERTLDVLRWLDGDTAAVLLVPPGLDAVSVLAAGGRGMLSRDADGGVLEAGVRAAASGVVVLDPAFAEFGRSPGQQTDGPMVEELTSRETEVLQLLAEGLPNKKIAGRLGLSEHTVKFHVDAILGKLGAHPRTEAVTRAARQGLILL